MNKILSLNSEKIQGKKLKAVGNCRGGLLGMAVGLALFCVFALCVDVLRIDDVSMDEIGIGIGIISSLFLFLYIICCCSERTVCVLAKDRLFFFYSEVMELSGAYKTRSFSDGSVAFSEVRKIEYFSKRGREFPCYAMLTGADFRVCLSDCTKMQTRRIARLCKKHSPFFGGATPDFDAIDFERKGLFADLWEIFAGEKYREKLDPSITVLEACREAADNAIYLTLLVAGREFDVCLDDDRGTMFGERMASQTIYYEKLTRADAVFDQVNTYARRNSRH